MRATRSEQTLRRLYAWLRWDGQTLTPALEQAVLQALAEVVAAGEPDLFGACLRELQRGGWLVGSAGNAAGEVCPPPTPPLRRSSIGYGSY